MPLKLYNRKCGFSWCYMHYFKVCIPFAFLYTLKVNATLAYRATWNTLPTIHHSKVQNLMTLDCLYGNIYLYFSGRSYLGFMASKCKLTIQDVNERDRHDQDADQHVRHCKWPQEEVCCILQLLLQRHGQDNQNISSYRQKDNHKNQQGWPVLLLHRLLFNPMRRGWRRGGEIESVVSREEALVQAHGGIPRPDHPANEV